MSTLSEVREAVQAIAMLLDQHYERVENSNAKTRNAVRARGARTEPVTAAAARVTRLSSSAGALAGLTLRNTTGADVVVDLLDGQDDTGTFVATVVVPAGRSEVLWPGADGPSFSYGLVLVQPAAGAVVGAVHLAQPDTP